MSDHIGGVQGAGGGEGLSMPIELQNIAFEKFAPFLLVTKGS
jgi:hypothetical protein